MDESVSNHVIPRSETVGNAGAASLVTRRPHFVLVGDEARFMASRRPHRVLSAAEISVWGAIAVPRSIGQLAAEFGEGVTVAVEALWRAEMLELVEPRVDLSRRRILIIEPHADDAALSLGGTMWQLRESCHFTVLTVASKSNFTSYYYSDRDYFDTDAISALRRSESQLFASLVGGEHLNLDLADAPLRYRGGSRWSLEYFRQHRQAIAISTSRLADGAERDRWMAAIESALQSHSFEELWMPLGGPHADHRLTTNCCLTVLKCNPELTAGRVLKFYEEVPYSSRFPDYTSAALDGLRSVGIEVEATTRGIDDVFEQKMRLISVYGSQFKVNVMRPDVESAGRLAGDATHKLAERLWVARNLPSRFDTECLWAGGAAVAKRSATTAAKWLHRHREARRIRIILQLPTGGWDRDLALLSKSMPHASFDVFASSEAAREVEAGTSKRVRLRTIGKGGFAWLKLVLELAGSGGVPTLFLVANTRLRIARFLSMAWFRSDVLLLTTMDSLHVAPPSRETVG